MTAPAFAGEDVDLLALLSKANRQRLLENSRRELYPAGTVAFPAGGPGRVFLLSRGLVRAYWAVPDGREATVAFIYPGNLVGARNVLPGTAIMRGPALTFVQVVADSTLTILDVETVRSLAGEEIEVVSRALKRLRADGIVETAPGMTRVLDPVRLAQIVRTFVI